MLAAGAEERPIAFGGNDVPGVMLASAMRTYANRYGTASGKSVVVFTNNDSGYRTARDLKAHGVHVEAIVDSRPASAADPAGTPVLFGRMIAGVKGRKRVSGVELTDRTHIDCDAVAVSGGWNPIVNLLCHRGDKPRWNSTIAGFVPGTTNRRRSLPPDRRPARCCSPNVLRTARLAARLKATSRRFRHAATRRSPSLRCGG